MIYLIFNFESIISSGKTFLKVGGLREVEGVGKIYGGILSTLTYSEGTGFKSHFSVVLSPVFKYLCSKSFVQIPLCFGRVLTFLFRNLINFFSIQDFWRGN